MEKINGGMSNDVFKYKNLLFKFYNYSQLKLNYNWEQTIQMKFYSLGLNTPRIYQSIEVDGKLIGRIEQFIESNPITIDEFRCNIKSCANILKQIHEISLEGLGITSFDFFDYINLWENNVLELKSFDLDYQILNDYDHILKLGQLVKNKINEMCKLLAIPKVVSHNDFQQLNLLIDSSGKWYIIDFEYSSLNYPFYDIANYFAECSFNNIELKYYPELYPSKESRYLFYSYYFNLSLNLSLNNNENFEQIDELVKEFSKLVDYTWFIWSVIKYHDSKSTDYLKYGLIRKTNFIKLTTEYKN